MLVAFDEVLQCPHRLVHVHDENISSAFVHLCCPLSNSVALLDQLNESAVVCAGCLEANVIPLSWYSVAVTAAILCHYSHLVFIVGVANVCP